MPRDESNACSEISSTIAGQDCLSSDFAVKQSKKANLLSEGLVSLRVLFYLRLTDTHLSCVCTRDSQPFFFADSQPESPSSSLPAPSTSSSSTSVPTAGPPPGPEIPVGKWRDGFWDLFRHGIFHCSVLNSCCCSLIAAGQVISRLHLTWLGVEPRSPATAVSATKHAFKTLLYMTFAFWITRLLLLLIVALLDPNVGNESGQWIEPGYWYYFFALTDDILALSYMGFTIFLLNNLRVYVRNKYKIPKKPNYPSWFCEDCCCSCICPCLVVAQLMRHTTDYSSERGRCCTTTGLSAQSV